MGKKGFLIICLFSVLVSCRVKKDAIGSIEMPTEKYIFPMDWIGHYEGELTILNPLNDTTQLNMQLIIDHPDALGVYPWVLIYGEEDIRSYGLEAIDASKGHYLIDEYNSIKIDSYLSGNNFVSRFEVLGSNLLVDYERNAAGIEINLYVSQKKAINTTGGEKIGEEIVPNVNSFGILAVQKAQLYKIK